MCGIACSECEGSVCYLKKGIESLFLGSDELFSLSEAGLSLFMRKLPAGGPHLHPKVPCNYPEVFVFSQVAESDPAWRH